MGHRQDDPESDGGDPRFEDHGLRPNWGLALAFLFSGAVWMGAASVVAPELPGSHLLRHPLHRVAHYGKRALQVVAHVPAHMA